MISFRAFARKVVEGLAQPMASADGGRVFRMSEGRLPQDPLEQRIVALGDGRSTGEIVEALYVEEIKAGA